MPHLAKQGGWKVGRTSQRKVMGIYLIPIKAVQSVQTHAFDGCRTSG